MEKKLYVGQVVTLSQGNDILSGIVLSVNREFTIVKFDGSIEISLLRGDKIMELKISEEVAIA